MIFSIIPARLGSQRLKRKNLLPLLGKPLIVHAIEKCKKIKSFDEIWVNSADIEFKPIALGLNVNFHERPAHLGENNATSEDFIFEFLQNHECDWIVQVHSIAPLLGVGELEEFVEILKTTNADVVLATEKIELECVLNGSPVNFQLNQKTNSQDLEAVQKITWAVSAWRRSTFIQAKKNGYCATYFGNILYVPLKRFSGHVIKTQLDFDVAEKLLPILE